MRKCFQQLLIPRRSLPMATQVSLNSSLPPDPPKCTPPSDRSSFMSLFPTLATSLSCDPTTTDLHPHLSAHISSLLHYTVPGGKMNRGLSVPATYQLLVPPSTTTTHELQLANTLGWTVELLQAFFLVADDIMDGSITRRGQPCWYKKQDIGLGAFNDSIILETCVYSIIRNYFRSEPYYLDLLENMLEVTKFTTYGQSLDTLSAHNFTQVKGQPNSLDSFDMSRYSAIVKYKTSYYSFYLPVSLAMNIAGIKDPELFKGAKTILLEMGHYFQVTDDFLDCFGDPEVTGKVGTDIQDGKCSWIVVKALEIASDEQKKILALHYGSQKTEDVEVVKELYNKLDLIEKYNAYETQFYADILEHIEKVCAGNAIPKEVFTTFLNRIYKRTS
eukprot:GFUD01074094.1.p1 GENE.GFUD01074094.1~~GFUD01074094.1.p1  ORF type:complete len:388 (-),score=78.24 GFUD01074094.1:438-1601(-)